jgi:hypothetical protein
MAKLLTGTRIYGTANVDSVLRVGNTTPANSTSNTTGSLIVTGGVGVSGNIYVGGTSAGINGVYTDILRYAANGLPWVMGSGGGGSSLDQFARDTANAGYFHANGAFIRANSAFDRANSSVNFGTIRVSGQPDVIANTANARLTFVAGSGMTITTVGTSNTITFASTGGGGSISITDDTTNSGTYYPLLGTVTTGTLSTANTSSTKLYYQPSTGILNATNFNSLSDRNKKTDIQIISNSLNIVENLNGITFKWIENGLPSAGLIAQDVEKYLPQLISNGENGKTLNYDGVIGVLVEAIKELSQRVKYLEGK